jgi:hypothetical protein
MWREAARLTHSGSSRRMPDEAPSARLFPECSRTRFMEAAGIEPAKGSPPSHRGLVARLCIDDGVKGPGAGDALEFVLTTVLERDPGPDDEIFDGVRRQH